jgi:beta-N-acetylglucosaminidase/uncharacterized protein YgiM (DUF1202 family)
MKFFSTYRFRILLILSMTAAIVCAAYLTSFAVSVPNARGQVNSSDGAYLRKGSSTSTAKLALLKDNTSLTIHKEVFKTKSSNKASDRWYYVTAAGKKGYIRADLVDSIRYGSVTAKATDAVNYRKGAGTGFSKAGTLKKGKAVTAVMVANPVSGTQGSSATWYKVKIGSGYYYLCSKYVTLTGKASQAQKASSTPVKSDAKFEAYMKKQGFPESYKPKLRALHNAHPNWVFVARKTNISWNHALSRQTRKGVSLIHRSYPKSYRSGSRQMEPGWYNASSKVVAYYMDPRNFLNENNIYMFEDLTYKPAYQTQRVVNAILAPSKLPKYGFSAKIFVNAGSKTKVSPVFLASRARQETGNGSDAITGKTRVGKVYNPFNIGAFGGSNPLYNGLLYARAKGWTTPSKAVEGGANELAKNYIKKGQYTGYYQRFNVRNGAAKVGTHQYMTNISAAYSESLSTKKSYTAYGVSRQAIVFEIPIYNGMPTSTKLP